jgi:uncharacterized protein (AIM24 family)
MHIPSRANMAKPLSDTQKHVTELVQEDTAVKTVEPQLPVLDVEDNAALCPLHIKFASAGQEVKIWHNSLMSHTRGVGVHTEPWCIQRAFNDIVRITKPHAHTLRATEKCEASLAPHRTGQMVIMDFGSGDIIVQTSALVASDTAVRVLGVHSATPNVGEFDRYFDFARATSTLSDARLVLCSLKGHMYHQLEVGESINVDESRVLAWTENTDCVVGRHAVRFTGPGEVLVQVHSTREIANAMFSDALIVIIMLIGLFMMCAISVVSMLKRPA